MSERYQAVYGINGQRWDDTWKIVPGQNDGYPILRNPTVTGVSVSPASASVMRGGTQQFSSTVSINDVYNPSDNVYQRVTWSVSGNTSTQTTINSSGRLTVAANETATTLTVRATSTFDNTISGTATVTVAHPVVLSVTVEPSSVSVQKTSTYQFAGIVDAHNGAPETVTWSVTGNASNGTTINANGLLTVAANETATSLTVRATSTFDNTMSGTATVTVQEAPIPPGVISVTVLPQTASVRTGATQQFSANVAVQGNAASTVTWNVSGNASAGTTISSGGLLSVASNETATSLTIRATSTFDGTKSGTATVTIPSVQGVKVTPESMTGLQNRSYQFSATVIEQGNASNAVDWNVSGNSSTGTIINQYGLLTIASDETSTTLTVTATSMFDRTKSGNAIFNLVVITVNTLPITVRANTSNGSEPVGGATVELYSDNGMTRLIGSGKADDTGVFTYKWVGHEGLFGNSKIYIAAYKDVDVGNANDWPEYQRDYIKPILGEKKWNLTLHSSEIQSDGSFSSGRSVGVNSKNGVGLTLTRPHFSLNFTVAYDSKNLTYDRVRNIMRGADKYLLEASDGYFSIDKVYMEPVSNMNNFADPKNFAGQADIRFDNENDANKTAFAYVTAYFGSNKASYRMQICFYNNKNYSNDAISRSIVHEIGHYVWGMRDEYLDGNYNRFSNRPSGAPSNFGLMDYQYNKIEMSIGPNYNYLPNTQYPAANVDCVPTNTQDDPNIRTCQHYYHGLSSWDFLKNSSFWKGDVNVNFLNWNRIISAPYDYTIIVPPQSARKYNGYKSNIQFIQSASSSFLSMAFNELDSTNTDMRFAYAGVDYVDNMYQVTLYTTSHSALPASSALKLYAVDFDGSGLTVYEKYLRGLDPTNPDNDGDGVRDGDEVRLGLDPLNPMTDGVTPDAIAAYGQFDLAVTDIEHYVDGDIQGLRIKVENLAGGKRYNVPVSLYLDDEKEWTWYVDIEGGETKDLSFIALAGDSFSKVFVIADEEQKTFDGNYSNNSRVYYVNAETRIVSFNVDGKITEVVVKLGDKISQPANPEKTGYTFDGWRIGSVTGPHYDFDAHVTENITLYAAWKQNPNDETINITGITTGNGQANVNFAIASANGKGYTVYLSETNAPGSFKAYSNVNYNNNGAHIRGLTNGKKYYAYIEYMDANVNVSRSGVVEFTPR